MSMVFCSVEGCNVRLGHNSKRLYCDKHLYRFKRYGSPLYVKNHIKSGREHGNFKHGKSPEYRVWMGMKRRCYYQKDYSYENYGARGIKVCDKWLGEKGFDNFLADMGPRPQGISSKGRALYSIDRIDVNGDYCPENCRWATMKEQSNNRRSNRRIHGKTLAQWGEELGGSRHMIRKRLQKGWSEEEAVRYQVDKIPHKHHH